LHVACFDTAESKFDLCGKAIIVAHVSGLVCSLKDREKQVPDIWGCLAEFLPASRYDTNDLQLHRVSSDIVETVWL
jgi:hypothetical protein